MPNAEGFLLPGLEADFVIAAHDEIIARSGGLPGLAHGGSGGVESALQRASNHALYADVGEHDVLSMAALYAVSIARGHVFNDGNKRTALTCALAFLHAHGFDIAQTPQLEDVMVEVASGQIDWPLLANYFYWLWQDTPAESNATPPA